MIIHQEQINIILIYEKIDIIISFYIMISFYIILNN